VNYWSNSRWRAIIRWLICERPTRNSPDRKQGFDEK
jgi:hypothetical protein